MNDVDRAILLLAINTALICAAVWLTFAFVLPAVEAFRAADPAPTYDEVAEGLTCAPQCAREW